MAEWPAESRRRAGASNRGWLAAIAAVFAFGFTVLGLLGGRIYRGQPPLPDRVVDGAGRTLFTGREIMAGQGIFLRNGLMEYGSILGHGAYLGPDYTADYLRRSASIALEANGGADSASAAAATVRDFKANRYDPATRALAFSPAQARAFESLVGYYAKSFGDPTTRFGLRPRPIADPSEVRSLTAFFAWTAWSAAALRPGRDYTYTNNWPPEPLVGNRASPEAFVWSVLSLIALLGGIGIMLAIFGRWRGLGWHPREGAIEFLPPGRVPLTPSQRTTAWFFLAAALMFLAQSLLGGSIQHYRTELTNFFGLDLARWLPFNLARAWHLQLGLFWIATSFLAAGIFIAPMIGGREPRHQHRLAFALLGALVVVVAGSLISEAFSILGPTSGGANPIATVGWEYLDLGFVWQACLAAGLVLWAVLLFRALRSRLRAERPGSLPWMFFLAALAVPAFYAAGLLAPASARYAVADYWRWWVVHLWVEDFLELFTTVVVACLFMMLGVVREKVALRLVYLDVLLYSVGGVIGTMHHMYFSGAPVLPMALGAVFSAAEVVPLTFLTVEAWSFVRVGTARMERPRTPFPHHWAVMFLIAVGFWNFLGAGIFGFLINLPIVSYYEIGTALTANHAHTALMGVYGMLAVGLGLFALRYHHAAGRWSDRGIKFGFWALNIGLFWMSIATLLPLGVVQLYRSVGSGYFEARSLEFLTSGTNKLVEWLRFPGDVLFIAGIVPFVLLAIRAVASLRRSRPAVEPGVMAVTEGEGGGRGDEA